MARFDALRRSQGPAPEQVLRLAREAESSARRRDAREANRPRPKFDQQLPVIARREEIAKAIAAHQAVVICGETGSGKTTQLPQICLALGLGAAGMIGHTQPRRIAARTVAQRIADELGSPLGRQGAVGFKVRFGDETSPDTYIKLMTDGILLAETQGDRDLEQYDAIIIDEAHERSLNIDFLMGYLRQMMPRRPDLKIIITSATIDPQKLSNHFGGPGKCPIVEVSGRTYPVEVRYRAVEEAEPDDFETDEERAILDAVDELARKDLPKGDVLIFLPGEREIRQTAEALRKHHPPGTEILPLYARLSPAEQLRVFQPHGGRRIVLATNVAETSLTVPGIRYVVDTGLARISRYSHRNKVQRLPVEPVSQASANQRAGRCGRVAAGVCIRLYSEEDFKKREAFTEPEILRTNLASVILQMKSLRLGPVEEFPFVDPPDARMIRDGYETLEELGAMDEHGELTKLGRDLAKLPLDPRIGRLLLAGAAENCLSEVLVIASALEVQDPRDRPLDKQSAADEAQARFKHEQSDFLTYVNIWEAHHDEADRLSHGKLRDWCRRSFLNFTRMREWVETHGQIRRIITEMGLQLNSQPGDYDRVHRALLAGLLSNVCSKNEAGGGFDYHGARGSKVSIFPGSTLFKKGPKWFVAAEIVQTTRLYARTIAKVNPEWIEDLGAHVLKRSYTDPHWSAETGQVSAWERATLFGLVLVARRRVHYGPIDPVASREIFIHRALVEGDWPEGRNEAPFEGHNRGVIEQIQKLEAKLRRSDILADKAALFAFYDRRVPAEIHSSGVFDRWRAEQEKVNPRLLRMSLDDVLAGDAKLGSGGVAGAYPDVLPGTELKLEYVFEPGSDRDGVTLVTPLASLPQLDEARCEWLTPGLLREKVHGLLKTLPKHLRVQLDGEPGPGGSGAGSSGGGKGGGGPTKTGLAGLADDVGGVLAFGRGTLAAAMTEALEVLRGVSVPVTAWQPAALPSYLRLNVRVLDERGKLLGEGRDLAELKQRYGGRARKALAGLARAQFGREGLTTWDFDELPERFETERAGQSVVAFPALADRGESVALTLMETPEAAAAATHAGVRRLLALACREELSHRLRSLSNIDALYKWFAPLGEPGELKGSAIDLIVEKAFLAGQGAIRTREQFEERQTACWGRLGQVTIEVGGLLSRVLEARHKIAARLGSGVPRTWAVSVADIREHAAYLMPKGFLRLTPLDRLREYPRYVEAMRMRLEKLREGGSTRETKALADLMPHWKRYTGWVAQAAGEAKAREEAAGGPENQPESAAAGGPAQVGPGGKPRGNQPLPQARRAAPVVPTEAAAWAAKAGSLPAEVETYRWMLEEFRVSLFAQELGTAQSISAKRLEEQWARCEPARG